MKFKIGTMLFRSPQSGFTSRYYSKRVCSNIVYVPTDVPRRVSGLHGGPAFVHAERFAERPEFRLVREKLAGGHESRIGQVLEQWKPEGGGRRDGNVHGHHRPTRVRVTGTRSVAVLRFSISILELPRAREPTLSQYHIDRCPGIEYENIRFTLKMLKIILFIYFFVYRINGIDH